MEYTVIDNDGRSVKFEADNWMAAAAACLAALEVDINALGRLVCAPRPDGAVVMRDELSGLAWTVKEKAPPPVVRVMASARSELLSAPPEPDPGFNDFGDIEDDEPSQIYNAPPPALSMPPTRLAREPVESLAERLFDLSMDLVVAEPEEAMGMALDILAEFVPSELAVAVRGSLNDETMQVLEARGTGAKEIIGRHIPFGEGLVGTCFDMRESIAVQDVTQSIPYESQYDGVDAFEVGCVLVVPLVDDDTLVHGVLELLNPPGRAFLGPDIDAVEMIARTLGQALANR
ncbi:MAG: GAF domain-containing protein [Myxococcota bacterium]